MPHDTDERLKSYLDTNQLHREQICLAILAVDKRFSEVRPRHPRGGPDGGRDIEAIFRGSERAFGAVGFVNQANDSKEHKKSVSKKFKDDVNAALRDTPPVQAFFFLTNVNLTVREKDRLVRHAKQVGLPYCEIFDRERIRIALDSPDGLAIRFQYLRLPLSEAEQASFFARWGDDIQSVISTGFRRVEATLARLLFLTEASDIWRGLTVILELDQTYPSDDLGHFRAFCYLELKAPQYQIFGVQFGRFDRPNRVRDTDHLDSLPVGVKYGTGGAQWEHVSEDPNWVPEGIFDRSNLSLKLTSTSSAIGSAEVDFLIIDYTHDSYRRLAPRLRLRDIDDASFIAIVNKSLAERIRCIHVLANGYKLQEISQEEFHIDTAEVEVEGPVPFTATELADPWVRIRPNRASTFRISYSDQTPRRMFSSRQTSDNAPWRQTRKIPS